MKNVFITIPAFREHRNIVQLCEKIQLIDTKDYNFNILIVDDSDDLKTLNAFKVKKLKKNVLIEKRSKKLGRGSAVLLGMNNFISSNQDNEIFVEMDADHSHSVDELLRNLNFFSKNNLDLLISSRYLKKSKILNWPISRRIFSKLSNKLTKITLGVPVSDYTNGYRIYSRKAIHHTVKNCGKIGDGFIILSEILVQLYYNKFKVGEIDSLFTNRVRGESSVTFKEIKNSLKGLIKLFFIKQDLNNL